MAKIALYALASGLVLDRTVFVGQTAAEMQTTLDSVMGAKKRFVIVDNASAFFSADNLLSLMKANDPNYVLVAQQANITISDEQLRAIQTAEATQAAIKLALKPKWEFQEVPAGWSFDTDVSFGATAVRRKRPNSLGESDAYRITPNQAEKLWKIASKVWAKAAKANTTIGAQYWDNQNHYKSGTVYADRVAIGCQAIRRYELEQIAVHKGWAFPATAN